MSGFGVMLKAYRLEAELTQEALAERAGVGLDTIGALERGVNEYPRKDTVIRLVEALELGEEARALFMQAAKSRPRLPGNGHKKTRNNNGFRPGFDGAQIYADYLLAHPRKNGYGYGNGDGDTAVEVSTEARKGDDEGVPTIRMARYEGELPSYLPVTGFQSILRRLRDTVNIRRRVFGLSALAALLFALLLAAFTGGPVVVAGDRIPLDIVGGKSGLQIYPVSTTEDGRLYITAGQPLTVTFTVRNTDQTGLRIAAFRNMNASVRGPDACRLGWKDFNSDFPPLIGTITLHSGQEYRYVESRIFDVPGVYFVEPMLLKLTGKWGAIGPYPRVYFTVVDKVTGKWPAYDSSCTSVSTVYQW
ncbi:MAG: helix-turn-helix transcriptional regulator [Chloroflexia bacterium]